MPWFQSLVHHTQKPAFGTRAGRAGFKQSAMIIFRSAFVIIRPAAPGILKRGAAAIAK